MPGLVLGLVAASVASGCAAPERLVLSIESTPPGAHCELIRGNIQLGGMTTPGRVHVSPSRQDIQVVCSKPGYRDALFLIPSEEAGFEASDLLLPMASTMKSLKGHRNGYQTSTRIELVRVADR
ncbi:hypothetical protein [Pararhodospirillum oryzae]|uniref:hypothetical protein n=1 Tax=Pararhodospirillum oryzae TaxID=478448 RepID=UPI0011BE8FDC|nr:hypothetical protein [Pararhodospirillum oryzae]